ncbi:hypothetical protein EV421DRAFT_1441328 [Armillaria borealis]|uniref:Uncharacterized protein n=1 Tax=Armillaria borealis TaxID=47425 RepID=A0AA39J0I7_9AGAR|nr:hypothetical protein EV421DRAFT_1441328 [Armillaria borealis]
MTAAITYLGTATPELTDSQIEAIFVNLDTQLNNMPFAAFLHGIYTGVVAVTLWAVASRNKCQDYRRPHFLVFTILLLYIVSTVGICYQWSGIDLMFIAEGGSFWTSYSFVPDTSALAIVGIVALLSTVLADATLIWRCWIVWGRSWCIVLVPIACTTLATASRGIITYYTAFGPLVPPRALFLENLVRWSVLYSSLILATLLWCTILIIYRIWRVGGAAGRIRVYQRVIEMLVESASLYSAMLVVLVVLEARNAVAGDYIEELAVSMRGIIPTVLVGRVAAGHARPDDSWSESTMRSSLRFGNHSSSHNDTEMSVGSGWDTSSAVRPDLEEGLEDITEVHVEETAPTASAHDYSAHVVGTSSSVDYSVV